jgi:O-antigen ligase
MLPALRIDGADRGPAVALLVALIWAAASTRWSPYHPKGGGAQTLAKLTAELPIFWIAWCGARRADPRLTRLALRILAWSMAVFALLLLLEAALGGELYRRLHMAAYEPIRPDLAIKNLGQSTFVLALLWPLAAVGGSRAGAPAWLALPMALGAGVSAHVFGADAPVISLGLALLAGWLVWRWPRQAPTTLAIVAAAFFLLMPAIVWSVRAVSDFSDIEARIPRSWADRMAYWSHAVDWIGDHPLRGWGLDASRMFSPGIQLHPHDGALQVWLELGALGAVLAAAFWFLTLRRLSRPRSDGAAAALAASAAVYLLFGGVNFGIWQEWWLGLGAYVAVLGAMTARQPPAPFEGRPVRESTFAPI